MKMAYATRSTATAKLTRLACRRARVNHSLDFGKSAPFHPLKHITKRADSASQSTRVPDRRFTVAQPYFKVPKKGKRVGSYICELRDDFARLAYALRAYASVAGRFESAQRLSLSSSNLETPGAVP